MSVLLFKFASLSSRMLHFGNGKVWFRKCIRYLDKYFEYIMRVIKKKRVTISFPHWGALFAKKTRILVHTHHEKEYVFVIKNIFQDNPRVKDRQNYRHEIIRGKRPLKK